MKTRLLSFWGLVVIAIVLLAACGAAAPAEEPAAPDDYYAPAEEPAAPAMEAPAAPDAFAAEAEAPAQDESVITGGAGAVYEIAGESGESVVVQNTNRKIIKNADMRLLVKDTDVAIDRATQIVTDLGGYIVSSRTWYQDYFNNNLRYATITIGIPVDQFERALQRFRDLSSAYWMRTPPARM